MFGLPGGLTTVSCQYRKVGQASSGTLRCELCASQDVIKKMGFCRIEPWVFIFPSEPWLKALVEH